MRSCAVISPSPLMSPTSLASVVLPPASAAAGRIMTAKRTAVSSQIHVFFFIAYVSFLNVSHREKLYILVYHTLSSFSTVFNQFVRHFSRVKPIPISSIPLVFFPDPWYNRSRQGPVRRSAGEEGHLCSRSTRTITRITTAGTLRGSSPTWTKKASPKPGSSRGNARRGNTTLRRSGRSPRRWETATSPCRCGSHGHTRSARPSGSSSATAPIRGSPTPSRRCGRRSAPTACRSAAS